ncbi:MAG TPA: type I DNA topoisomerase [Candidatus Bathyarchaeia archaeon]|nr:type I DNA topoisomerase [Candidatus Bathyarchaeia archaeon]
MDLIIVESPTKARTISLFIKGDYSILATMGHIRDLPKKKLGVEVEKDFQPQYVQLPGKKAVIRNLEEAIGRAKKVYLATDPDREGEAIAYHVTTLGPKTKFLRITFHEITGTAIQKALSDPGAINMPLVNAQQARRILDRLVGYKLSPLLWRKIRIGLSAGRVQSVAVRLIVDREREIEKFIPEEYWEIACQLRKRSKRKKGDEPSFIAKLVKKNGKSIKVKNKTAAEEVVEDLNKAGFRVEKVEQKEIKNSPPPPFITSTLQRTAFAKLGFTSKQTMQLAQSLYEKGLITYHRTDSVALSGEALGKIRESIKLKYGDRYLPETPRYYKTRSKVAQEAHEAIRPTDFQSQIPDNKFQNGQEKKLFGLIFKRTVASQIKPSVFDQTKVFVKTEKLANLYLLLAEGKLVKFDGWLVVYSQIKNEAGKECLPLLKPNDELVLLKVLSEQKFTQPPGRYNEATLIKALEDKDIGRPSTYAPIIATIQLRQYVEKEEKKFKPTSLGITVNDFLLKYFPHVFDYSFTAQMEDELDDIARGKKNWVVTVTDFYQPFSQKLTEVLEVAERVKIPAEATGQKCPKCQSTLAAGEQGELVIKVGRFGKFIACSRFPKCDYRASYVEKLPGIKCPECGGEIVIKKTKRGKKFYGCSNYPKCKWASWRKPMIVINNTGKR